MSKSGRCPVRKATSRSFVPWSWKVTILVSTASPSMEILAGERCNLVKREGEGRHCLSKSFQKVHIDNLFSSRRWSAAAYMVGSFENGHTHNPLTLWICSCTGVGTHTGWSSECSAEERYSDNDNLSWVLPFHHSVMTVTNFQGYGRVQS